MKKVLSLLPILFLCFWIQAQPVSLPTVSKKAAVAEWIGLTKVEIEYHRPGVKGREGNIYGENGIVPYNNGKPMPWRAGADENTIISFDDEVLIEGKALPAGKYGFFIAMTENQWTLIFSKNHWSWGAYFYDPADDALRVNVAPMEGEHVEWLEYRFVNQTDRSADVEMSWESRKVQFTVEVDLHTTTMRRIERELEGGKGFTWDGWNSAAQYCLLSGKDLEKGLAWVNNSIDPNQGGQKNFTNLSTKSQLLEKLGRANEAKPVMEEALTMATMIEMHFYARSLIDQNRAQEALKMFELNRAKNPMDNFTTYVGLGRGYMAVGKYKEAAGYFRMAAPNAPPGQNTAYEDLARQCEEKM
ncbi:MAG: DUF2911 domain-containing protein [Saprospirales bacterium]|jgi:tetratricopeptide (TPR) repeat protein|nr:DUF2911 domain-containing protein [Saprospirales bacterium]MBK6902245.1 DUF2911 domain-containing protein [Saprospirales bacterium]MBK7335362.1 DUF2911 domain-containing protein [Saprospirales bacterium]